MQAELRFQQALDFYGSETPEKDKVYRRTILDCIGQTQTLDELRALLDDRSVKTLKEELVGLVVQPPVYKNDTVLCIEQCLRDEAKIK